MLLDSISVLADVVNSKSRNCYHKVYNFKLEYPQMHIICWTSAKYNFQPTLKNKYLWEMGVPWALNSWLQCHWIMDHFPLMFPEFLIWWHYLVVLMHSIWKKYVKISEEENCFKTESESSLGSRKASCSYGLNQQSHQHVPPVQEI
jgi:hypothetical protein